MQGTIRKSARVGLAAMVLASVVSVGVYTRAGAAAPAPHNQFTPRSQAHASVVGTPRLHYWGGAVIANVKVVVVLWGTGRYTAQVSRTTPPNVSTFFAAVTASPYVDWLREYNPKGAKIGRGSVATRVVINPAAANDGSVIDDIVNIRPELSQQIRARHLPAPDANTVYALFFPAGHVVTQGGHDSNTGFSAYHNTVRYRGAVNLRYAVLPATAAGRKCGAMTGFGNISVAASHELAEAITDPDVGLATRLAPPLGWYDPMNGEIADISAGIAANLVGPDGRTYTVQKLWSNRRHACVAS